MATPSIHAKNSVLHHGGKKEDYLDIHKFMDSSKGSFSDARHRTITHNIWFCVNVIPAVFGDERNNSDGKPYSPKDIAEEHCIEDIGHVPTIQDYLENMKIQDWMKGNSTVEKPVVNYHEKKPSPSDEDLNKEKKKPEYKFINDFDSTRQRLD